MLAEEELLPSALGAQPISDESFGRSHHPTNAHFDIFLVFEQIDDLCRVCVAVMVWVEDFRTKGFRSVGYHFRGHRVREIHGQKGNIDSLEILHLRCVFRVSCNVDPLVAEANNVSVASTLWMEGNSGASHLNEVICWYRFDFEALGPASAGCHNWSQGVRSKGGLIHLI